MADDNKGLNFKTVDELASFLKDLQGQMGNMQETIDKLQPSEESSDETDTDTDTDSEEVEEEPSEEEINEIDQLLQGK